MEKIKLRRKISLGFGAAKETFSAAKLLLATAKRKLEEREISSSPRRGLLFVAAKIKLDEKTILGLATAKKPFASAKRFTTAKDVTRHDKGKMFEIPISGLSQRRR